MEVLTKTLQDGREDAMLAALQSFVDKNKASFKLGESESTRKVFCTAVLSMLKQSAQFSPKLTSFCLQALRIFAREHLGVEQMVSKDGLTVIAQLAELTGPSDKDLFVAGEEVTHDRLEVIIEATKVICNVVLNHRHLVPLTTEIGCLEGLSSRLSLVQTTPLPHDLLFFYLRLLFLITACGPVERVALRDQYNGITVLHNIIDATLFGPTSVGGASSQTTPTCDDEEPRHKPMSAQPKEGVATVPTPLTERQCNVLCEALKILFNQTLHWREEGQFEEEELSLWCRVSHLLRILIVSLPLHKSKPHTDTLCHCVEVLVNAPEQCAKCFLLSPDVQVMPTLRQMNPDLYADDKLCSSNLDTLFDDFNMCSVVALVNLLHVELDSVSDRSHISTVLTALRVLSKGHRSIRRYLKSLLLPPLKEVKQRPDEGDSLKSRVVRLMTAGSLGAEEVAADFLFVLCKEKVSRLVKHTGFGNAAGLLLSRGLLGGGRSTGEDQYSSDSESSDTEEYDRMRDTIDPVTAAPMQPDEPSPLDEMTEEQREREAEELADLFDRLNRHGIIKVMPVDKDGKPVLDSTNTKPSDQDET